MKLHLEVLGPAAVATQPARLRPHGLLRGTFHVLIIAGAAFQAGCFGGGGDVQPAAGPEKAIAATVAQLQRATARHDYVAICGDLLTASARRRAGGPDCVRLTRSAAAGVERPRIELESIEIEGSSARVTVRTGAAGQGEAGDTLLLRRERGRWRVDSLGG